METKMSASPESAGAFHPHLTAIAIFVTVSVLSSNLLNLLVIYRMKKARSSTRILYASLSCADLCAGITLTFFIRSVKTGVWPYSQTMCTITGYFISAFTSISVYTMCALSIERCIIITRPFDSYKYIRKRFASLSVLLVWVLCLSASIWPIYSITGNLYEFRMGSLICALAYNKNIRTWLFGFILVICITLIVTTSCWIRIFYFVIKKNKQRNRLSASAGRNNLRAMRVSAISSPAASPSRFSQVSSKSRISESSTRSIRSPIRRQLLTILLMVTGFYASWTPYIVRQFQLAVRGLSNPENAEGSIWPDFFFGWTALSNGFWNCWIYSLTDRSFRSALLKIFCNLKNYCRRMCFKRSDRIDLNNGGHNAVEL